MPGPKKTPTAKLKLTGSWLVDGRSGEPRPRAGTPSRPAWVEGVAAERWDEIVPELEAVPGLLAKVDGLALGLHCVAYADFLEAREAVEANGLTATSDKGSVYQHPAVGVMNKAWARLVQTCGMFGLSPADRAGLSVSTGSGKDADGKSQYFQSG